VSALYLLGTPTGDLYAYALGAPVRSPRLYDPDYVIRQDSEAYAKMRRDAHIAHILEMRKHLVAGRDWFLEPASPAAPDRKLATLLEALVKRTPRFANARFNLTEAVFKGSAWAKIYHAPTTIRLHGDDRPRTWDAVTAIRDAAKFRFRLYRPDDVSPADVLENGPSWQWQIERPHKATWEPVNLDEWVHHVYDDAEETLGHGRGVAESLFHYWKAKVDALTFGEQFLDRWANGLIHCGIDSLRAGAVGTTVGPNRDDRTAAGKANAWANALNVMRHQHILVHDKSDDLGVVDPPSGGWNATKEAVEYYDGCMTRLVLGSVLPTNATEGGSYALGQVQENSTEALIAYDRTLLEETITEQLVRRLWAWNFSVFNEMGLAEAEPPYFRIREERAGEPEKRAAIVVAARTAGVPLRKDEVYAQLGFSPPAEGDDVLEWAPAPGAAGAGGDVGGARGLLGLGSRGPDGGVSLSSAADFRRELAGIVREEMAEAVRSFASAERVSFDGPGSVDAAAAAMCREEEDVLSRQQEDAIRRDFAAALASDRAEIMRTFAEAVAALARPANLVPSTPPPPAAPVAGITLHIDRMEFQAPPGQPVQFAADESIAEALRGLARPPVINVAAPEIKFEPKIEVQAAAAPKIEVNVEAPPAPPPAKVDVTVAPPAITVNPQVKVAATLAIPPRTTRVDVVEDSRGEIRGFEIREEGK
jgi:hypothetical protein